MHVVLCTPKGTATRGIFMGFNYWTDYDICKKNYSFDSSPDSSSDSSSQLLHNHVNPSLLTALT